MLELSKKRKRVIKRPLITAKSVQLAESNCYVFEVSPLANKHQIAEEFSYLFKAKANRVNTSAIRKHNKRKRKTRERDTKKAFIWSEIKLESFPRF